MTILNLNYTTNTTHLISIIIHVDNIFKPNLAKKTVTIGKKIFQGL